MLAVLLFLLFLCCGWLGSFSFLCREEVAPSFLFLLLSLPEESSEKQTDLILHPADYFEAAAEFAAAAVEFVAAADSFAVAVADSADYF